MFNVRLSLVAFILLWNASDVFCSHFRGGIITWRPDPHNPLKVAVISFFSVDNAKSRPCYNDPYNQHTGPLQIQDRLAAELR